VLNVGQGSRQGLYPHATRSQAARR
jgi:hypothetical protein